MIRFVLAKIFDGKKEVAVVQEIEAKPNNQDQEGGTI